LAKYDQDEMAKLLTHQRNEEDSVMEEEEDESGDEEDKDEPKEFTLWGEGYAIRIFTQVFNLVFSTSHVLNLVSKHLMN
jgi:hypothetical protein